MKIKTIFTLILSLFIVISCETSKKASVEKPPYTVKMQKAIDLYPDITGFEKRAIFLSKLKPDDEKEMKIEIIPGRDLLVDCNKYGVSGEMTERILEKNGNPFYLFNSRGEVFSTRMACPDTTRHIQFVSGQSIMADYRSDIPLVVYTAPTFEVKYSLWKADELKSIRTNNNKDLATPEATKNELHYPKNNGYERLVLYLPELGRDNEMNRKVELIPGKKLRVDCKNYKINGELSTEQVTGFGYDYWVFNSDESIGIDGEKCQKTKLQEYFVEGKSKIVSYNSRLPIVVYVPQGFEVNYKIWETNGIMY